MKEYAVWGIPPGEKEETLLLTRILRGSDAIAKANELMKTHGVTKARVQTIDMNECPSKLFNSKDIINGNS